MSEEADKFVNDKLGENQWTHSPIPMYRKELSEWLDEYSQAENTALKERIKQLEEGVKEISQHLQRKKDESSERIKVKYWDEGFNSAMDMATEYLQSLLKKEEKE